MAEADSEPYPPPRAAASAGAETDAAPPLPARGSEPPAAPAVPPAVIPPPVAFRPAPLGGSTGRRYGFLCGYCSSRLEANDAMAGQSGTCPTCGNAIVIPILDRRGRLIDPTTNQIIKQDPHPVHAYAAAGHRAPQILSEPDGSKSILCPRCQRHNPVAGNNCLGCGLPFTMDGTQGESVSGTNSFAVASLVLGIVALIPCAIFIPAALALIFGGVALRKLGSPDNTQSGRGLAIAGVILGGLGLLSNAAFFMSMR